MVVARLTVRCLALHGMVQGSVTQFSVAALFLAREISWATCGLELLAAGGLARSPERPTRRYCSGGRAARTAGLPHEQVGP